MDTPVTRFLDSAGIAYKIKPHEKEVFTCEDAARERGVRVSQVVKCMIGKDNNNNHHVMLIPGDKILKIKKARAIAGGIRIDLVTPENIVQELNLVVGAISPTQMVGRVKFFFIDNSVFKEEYVNISSGRPDAGVELKAEDLVRVLGAIKCDIISSNS